LYLEDTGVMFPQNVDTSQPNYTVLIWQDSDRHHIINWIIQSNVWSSVLLSYLLSLPKSFLRSHCFSCFPHSKYMFIPLLP
jgi:hypothetical protein